MLDDTKTYISFMEAYQDVYEGKGNLPVLQKALKDKKITKDHGIKAKFHKAGADHTIAKFEDEKGREVGIETNKVRNPLNHKPERPTVLHDAKKAKYWADRNTDVVKRVLDDADKQIADVRNPKRPQAEKKERTQRQKDAIQRKVRKDVKKDTRDTVKKGQKILKDMRAGK